MIRFGLNHYVKLFRKHSVIVTGMRGSGKDMLMSNIACRNKAYIGNVKYRDDDGYIPLDFDKLDVLNSSDDLISGNVTPYQYPYPDNIDIYISDAGIYFPSFDFKRLNSRYPRLPHFLALSRHLGDCNVHCNVQNLDRLWDKFREQSDLYIYCRSCRVIGSLVIQELTLYDRPESCQARVKPYAVRKPSIFAGKEARQAWDLDYARFAETHGQVVNDILIYFNKSSYDTRAFRSILNPTQEVSNP